MAFRNINKQVKSFHVYVRRARFAKYRSLNLETLHYQCFIPLLACQTQKSDCCSLDIFNSTDLFIISFPFAKYNKPPGKFFF